MMQFFSQALSDKLVVALVAAVAGMLGTLLVGALRTRSARFRYSTRVDRIGTSADDPVFGTVRVQWRNNDVRNLYIAVVEIENASSKDFEDVGLTIYTGNDTLLLSEQTRMIDSPNTVLWSPDFRARLVGPAGGVLGVLTQAQWEIYNHRREYLVPVFNRGQVLEFPRENSYTWARRGEAGLVQQSRTSFVRYHLAPLTFQNSLDESNRKSFALVGCGLKRRRKNLHVHVQQDAETIVGTIDQRKAPIRRDQSFQLSFRRQTLMATHFAWGEGCHGSLHGIEGSDGPRTNTPFPSE